ncbi:2OG-Fe(II) oxygenase [Pseudomonas putida]|nr:2OG-Fe(II) oxygenase [Pseudomonas putida]
MTDIPFTEKPTVLDKFITEHEQNLLTNSFSGAIWRYGWPINTIPLARPCWHIFIAGSKRTSLECCEHELASDSHWGFLLDIWRRTQLAHMRDCLLLGVYANGQTFGQDSPIHRDNKSIEPGKTAVLFCNAQWETTWGGELILFDQQKNDTIAAIQPKPGRIAIFDGHIPHRARAPTVDCDKLRITIAFKTMNKDIKQLAHAPN